MVLPSVKDTSIAATATTLTIKLSRLLAQITTSKLLICFQLSSLC